MQIIPTPLFPAYEEGSSTQQFFVSPALVPPFEVCYGETDHYGREPHISQFLTVPVTVPNYLGLCTAPGQKYWGVLDDIDANSLLVQRLVVSLNVKGEERIVFIDTKRIPTGQFVPAPENSGFRVLDMKFDIRPGYIDNVEGESIGDELFSEFKAVGYDPLFNVHLVGMFDRQRMALQLRDSSRGLNSLKVIDKGDLVSLSNVPTELVPLKDTIGEFKIVGVQLQQNLV